MVERLRDIAGLALDALFDGMDFVRERPEHPRLKHALRLRPTIKFELMRNGRVDVRAPAAREARVNAACGPYLDFSAATA